MNLLITSQHTGLYEVTSVLKCLPRGLCAPGIRPKMITSQENALAAKAGLNRKAGHKARKLRWRLAGIPTELIYLVRRGFDAQHRSMVLGMANRSFKDAGMSKTNRIDSFWFLLTFPGDGLSKPLTRVAARSEE